MGCPSGYCLLRVLEAGELSRREVAVGNWVRRKSCIPGHLYLEGDNVAVRDADALTRTTSAAVRGRLFEGLRVIDSQGQESVARGAKVLGGVGWFWGFNVFLNRRVRIDIDLHPTGEVLALEEVRRLVLKDFASWHGWEGREDLEALRAAVTSASTVGEIIRLITIRTIDAAPVTSEVPPTL
jgi:hypothetical protein